MGTLEERGGAQTEPEENRRRAKGMNTSFDVATLYMYTPSNITIMFILYLSFHCSAPTFTKDLSDKVSMTV